MKKRCIVALFTYFLVLGLVACQDDVGSNGDDNVRQVDDNNDTTDVGDDSGAPDVTGCDPGEVLDCADDSSVLICDEDGEDATEEACPSSEPNCLENECTDQICVPGTTSCVDDATSQACNSEGSDYLDPVECSAGAVCNDGVCESPCVLGDKMESSYFGCEYWTLYLDQYDDPSTGVSENEIPHAVVISNPNDEPTTIYFSAFESGVDFDIDDPVVSAGESRVFEMPRLALDGTGITQRGIFIQSTLPVTAHQFNPPNNDNVYSNDASLLLPTSALGTEYYAMTWPTQSAPCIDGLPCFEPQHGFVTVIATSNGTTTVSIDSTADIADGDGVNGLTQGDNATYDLEHGDVLNLQALSDDFDTDANDLTGTFVESDQPVAVFAGHEQAVVGYDSDDDSCCADHIEQQMLPLDSWGETYIAPFSPGRTDSKDHWRIMAGEDGVTVNTNPPQPDADGVTLDAGDFVAFFTDDDFEVEATGKIMVGQILVSQQQTAETIGDPAFVTAVPIERFRDDYLVLIPEGYNKDFITIIRPAGLEVTLDANPITETFAAVGDGDFETASIEVDAGVYVLEADEPFGVLAHGLDSAVSYGYPGGLNIVGEEDNGD